MNVLLICPPYSVYTPGESAVPPLGLARIAASAIPYGEVKVVDMAITESLGQDSWSHLIATLDAFVPDVVGIGPLVSANAQKTVEVAGVVKRRYPSAVIAIGGADPTFTYERRLREWPEIDAVFLGESDVSFPAWLEIVACQSKWFDVPGVAFRNNEKCVVTQRKRLDSATFNSLPRPAWESFPLESYAEMARLSSLEPYLPIESSRGCPLKCVFCACTELFENRMTYRSPKSVADEIAHYYDVLGYRKFVFNDDNIGINVRHLEAVADAIITRSLDGLKLALSSNIEARLFDDTPLLEKLARAGIVEIFFGCESPHPETIAHVGKTKCPEKWPQRIRLAVDQCRKVGIASRTNWILGLPTDTREKFLETISFVKELKPDSAFISLLQPYPGTPLSQRIDNCDDDLGISRLAVSDNDIVASRFAPSIRSRWMSDEDMVELAYLFLSELGGECEANVSGSPYYLFELWRQRHGVPFSE